MYGIDEPYPGTQAGHVCDPARIPLHLGPFYPTEMRNILLAASLTLGAFRALAAPGDTTVVTVHDAVDMVWFEAYDRWGQFPAPGTDYRKVTLHYGLGCASGGCSGWDYTTLMYLRHRPGYSDTTWAEAPSFTLNGAQTDSAQYSTDPTYATSWNGTDTDTLWLETDTIVLFGDGSDPLLPTDTLYVYPAGFWYDVFDLTGTVVDSVYANPTGTEYLTLTDYYTLSDHIDQYELARAITPYGTYMNPANNGYGTNGYNNTWVQDYYYDLTDYQHLLRDSVEIRAFYSGWSSGFSVTLDFEFIEGTPPMDVLSVDNLYQGDYTYSNATNFNTVQLPDKAFDIRPDAEGVRARVFVTGHGQDGEFTPNIKYFLRSNNNTVAQQTIWKSDCGKNALWPQGGTWVYDRANWCPGEAVRTYDHDITANVNIGQTNMLDINFSSFTPSNGASYSLAAQIIQHGAPNFALDAEVADIIAPTTKDEHGRRNPTCTNPVVRIRNTGSATLTSLTITYGVRGATAQNHTWTGSLNFLESTEVELPNLTDWNGSASKFDVSVSAPNGGTDGYALNNTMTSDFVMPDVITGTPGFEISLKSNNSPQQNSWKLYDAADQIVAERSNLTANTTYKDTVTLTSGCYRLVITDLGDDGLTWWANTAQGSGYFRLKKLGQTAIFKNFLSDFGSELTYTFNFEEPDGVNDAQRQGRALVFPNPTEGLLVIDLAALDGKVNVATLLDLSGRPVRQWNISQKETRTDLNGLAKGMYVLRLLGPDGLMGSERVMLH